MKDGIEIKYYVQPDYRLMKSDPKIEEIKITKKELSELKAELSKSITTTEGRNRAIKKIAGGPCSMCGGVPNKILTYDADGATVIERYCNKCFQKWKRYNRQ